MKRTQPKCFAKSISYSFVGYNLNLYVSIIILFTLFLFTFLNKKYFLINLFTQNNYKN